MRKNGLPSGNDSATPDNRNEWQKPQHNTSVFHVLIPHLKRRAVLRPGLPPIVEPGGGDVGVPEPLLHLGDVGLMVERIGGRRGPQ